MNGPPDSQPQATAVSASAMKSAIILGAAVFGPSAAHASAVKVERNSAALEFSYSYPAEAAAIAPLNRRFQADLATQYRRALQLGVEDLKIYKQEKRAGISDFFSMEWTTAGQTPRLLSLQNQFSAFTGGAHPNTSYGALLWDRRLGREIKMETLFLRPGAFAALTRSRYCATLNAERSKRRDGEKLDLADFNACPKYSGLAIALVDKNRNGRFDAIDFVASPYTAGPYAEGKYEISLPVTSQLIAAIKPDYRNSFERQRQ